MQFSNATSLDTHRMQSLFERFTQPFRHDQLVVRLRYSRGADYSGSCYYTSGRIFINLGRHLVFPYRLGTHIGRSMTVPDGWVRPVLWMPMRDGEELALFIYLHELFHYLAYASGRSPKRKEGMCDRFAARVLVDHFGSRVSDASGDMVTRSQWDFQDLDAFVARAPRCARAERRPIPVRIVGAGRSDGLGKG